MNEFQLVFRAFYVGLFTGYILALPTGPAGIESVRWTLTKGFKHGIFVAIGAIAADTLDVILINFGFLELLKLHALIEASFWILFGGVILFIGLRDRKRQYMTISPSPNKPMKTLKTHHAFLTGFLISMTYPGVHLFWITISTTVIRSWKASGPIAYYTFTVSLLMGMSLALLTLNLLAKKGRHITMPAFMKEMIKWVPTIIAGLGVVFILVGFVMAARHLL